ncbi:hypothetical protein D3C78_1931890 [compost metagenome]
MAVHDVLPFEVAEAQEHPQGRELFDYIHILTALLVRQQGLFHSILDLADDLPLFEVDMNGVGPTVFGIH